MTEPTSETPGAGESAPDQPKRFLFLRRRTPSESSEVVVVESVTATEGPPATDTAATAAAAVDSERVRPGVLRRRRRQLMDTYQQAIFDLGGLAMELHGRGLLAEDVMRRRAAEVADIRLQLDDLSERLDDIRQARKERRTAGRGSAVTCPACGARSPAKANFCAACGAPLIVAVEDVTEGDGEQITTVISGEALVVEDSQPTAAIPAADRDDA